MAKMPARRGRASFTTNAVLLLILLCLTGCASAHASLKEGTPAWNISGDSFNDLVRKRANDGNDADKNWWPFMGVEMQLSDAKIEELPNTEPEKKKLRAARKGLRLLCKMKSAVSDPPTSDDYKPTAERSAEATLHKYGWEAWFNKPLEDLSNYGLDPAFLDLGISTAPDLWRTSMVLHEQWTLDKDKNQDYPPTMANYDSIFNLKDGVLIAVANWGPEAQVQGPQYNWISREQIVPLRRWSDVVWLHREKIIKDLDAGSTAAPLKHIFRHHIINGQSLELFEMVTGKISPADVGTWPGLSYPINEPEALALLSSPNGFGPAWLLIQHKDSGSRMIDRINIFDCGNMGPGSFGSWCLYLHVTDVE